jgi:hypothetical protein
MYAYFMAVGINTLFCSVARRSPEMSCTIHSWTGMCWWLWQDYCVEWIMFNWVSRCLLGSDIMWMCPDMSEVPAAPVSDWVFDGGCRIMWNISTLLTRLLGVTTQKMPVFILIAMRTLSFMLYGGISVFSRMESTRFVKVKYVHHFMTFY